MGLGLGIFLLLAGLVLVLDIVRIDFPQVDEPALGILLIVVGVATIGLALVITAMQNRHTHIDDHHFGHTV